MNLLGNAIKFTKAGEVGLQVSVMAEEREWIELLFRVHDTGMGIPAEKQATIFDAFSQADGSITREFGGTGLGLSISSRLVQLFGGKIWVESEPGKGSAFQFTARFEKREQPEAAAPPAALAGLRILVVDDHWINLDLLDLALRKWKAKVELAGDGISGLGGV